MFFGQKMLGKLHFCSIFKIKVPKCLELTLLPQKITKILRVKVKTSKTEKNSKKSYFEILVFFMDTLTTLLKYLSIFKKFFEDFDINILNIS